MYPLRLHNPMPISSAILNHQNCTRVWALFLNSTSGVKPSHPDKDQQFVGCTWPRSVSLPMKSSSIGSGRTPAVSSPNSAGNGSRVRPPPRLELSFLTEDVLSDANHTGLYLVKGDNTFRSQPCRWPTVWPNRTLIPAT